MNSAFDIFESIRDLANPVHPIITINARIITVESLQYVDCNPGMGLRKWRSLHAACLITFSETLVPHIHVIIDTIDIHAEKYNLLKSKKYMWIYL